MSDFFTSAGKAASGIQVPSALRFKSSFRRMITPWIIEIVFAVGAVILVLYGLFVTFAGANAGTPLPMGYGREGANTGQVIAGLLLLFVGPVLWRIACELVIVVFRIHSELVAIHNQMDSQSRGAPGFPAGQVAALQAEPAAGLR